jgi:hypothetical protein
LFWFDKPAIVPQCGVTVGTAPGARDQSNVPAPRRRMAKRIVRLSWGRESVVAACNANLRLDDHHILAAPSARQAIPTGRISSVDELDLPPPSLSLDPSAPIASLPSG